ncbi:Ribose transport system permease protein RbsC [Mesorhizobium plurifarium]|uniref:Ribose transport system permease protein RbsC n=1 Tax=Mesorhizobium plurifarium TaxID=69974 RepID=A0A090F0X9_MESPL|nr:Ribose transport system permease protein RbsC [Mesorhizobium plurifarium]
MRAKLIGIGSNRLLARVSDTSSPVARAMSLARFDEAGLLIGLIVLVLIIGIPHPEFFEFGSIKTLLRQCALVGIMAFGMVYLVSMTEIDLSVGGIYAVAVTASALMIKSGIDPWIAVLLSLFIGAALGAFNSIVTAALDVPLIIVSLGTLSVFFGLNLIISDASPIFGMPRDHLFFRIFGGEFLGLPASAWVMFAVGVALHFLFFHTRFGATVRAIGANRAAADFIGVKVDRVRLYATALTGMLCALSAAMTLAYFKAVDPSMGEQKELLVIAAVVIGGTSLAGGSGTILGAFLGVLIINVIDSGIVFFGVDPNYARFVTGCVILAAIALDRFVKRRRQLSDELQSHL